MKIIFLKNKKKIEIIDLSWKKIFYKCFSELIQPLIINIDPLFNFSPPVILYTKWEKIGQISLPKYGLYSKRLDGRANTYAYEN